MPYREASIRRFRTRFASLLSVSYIWIRSIPAPIRPVPSYSYLEGKAVSPTDQQDAASGGTIRKDTDMSNEKTMADVLSYGPFTDEEIDYMCEWAPEMGDDLNTLRIWIDEYDLRPVGNDELENYLDDGYEVMLPADAGYDGGEKTIVMMH